MVGSISFIKNGVKITFPVNKLPTINPMVNEMVADKILEKFEKEIKTDPKVADVQKFCKTFENKFPEKMNKYDKMFSKSLKILIKKSRLK